MSKGVIIGNVVKRSVSLDPKVNEWAEELAAARGFGTNFSAFVADLVREAQASKPPGKKPAHIQYPLHRDSRLDLNDKSKRKKSQKGTLKPKIKTAAKLSAELGEKFGREVIPGAKPHSAGDDASAK